MVMSNEHKNPEYGYDSPPTTPRPNYWRITLIAIVALAISLIVLVAFAKGDDQPKSDAPPPPPIALKASPASLLAIREAQVKMAEAMARMEQLKQLYQQYQTQAQEAQKAIDAARKAAYTEAGVSEEKYDLDLETHEFRAKVKK